MRGLQRLVAAAALLAVGAALVKELRTPPDRRAWHGTVAEIVPYDFRVPTWERIRQTFWDPDGDLVVGQVFGVGWTLNVGRLARLLDLE